MVAERLVIRNPKSLPDIAKAIPFPMIEEGQEFVRSLSKDEDKDKNSEQCMCFNERRKGDG
jgi:hypothetical protein